MLNYGWNRKTVMLDKNKYQTIIYKTDGPVATLTLNRPDKLNAINAQMVKELNEALDDAESCDQVRAIILSGAGRAFSAGFDLTAGNDGSAESDLEFWRQELKRDFDIIMRFWDCPKPTIAAVHGYCLGSSMEMAVACDITISSEDCLFGAPEVKFGSGIVALILPWVIGVKAAKELLLTGDDKVTAVRALSLGLINRIVENVELEESGLSIARSIANNDRLAVKLTKQAINSSCEAMGMRESLLQALDADLIIETTETPESKEFNQILKQQGARAAFDWRSKKVNNEE
ncbi:MAG: enoyl-CoA hydratase [Gammaproteobacteria bacterium]